MGVHPIEHTIVIRSDFMFGCDSPVVCEVEVDARSAWKLTSMAESLNVVKNGDSKWARLEVHLTRTWKKYGHDSVPVIQAIHQDINGLEQWWWR
jgi:hypothetical protein